MYSRDMGLEGVGDASLYDEYEEVLYLFGSVWYPEMPQNVFIVIDYEVINCQSTSTLAGYPSTTGDKWVVPAMPGVAILGNRCLGRTGLVWLCDLFDMFL